MSLYWKLIKVHRNLKIRITKFEWHLNKSTVSYLLILNECLNEGCRPPRWGQEFLNKTPRKKIFQGISEDLNNDNKHVYDCIVILTKVILWQRWVVTAATVAGIQLYSDFNTTPRQLYSALYHGLCTEKCASTHTQITINTYKKLQSYLRLRTTQLCPNSQTIHAIANIVYDNFSYNFLTVFLAHFHNT